MNVLDDTEKGTVFEGAKLFISYSRKRLGEIALRTVECIKDEVEKNDVARIAFTSRRMGNDGVYWENLETWEKVIVQAGLEQKYIFLNIHNNGQTSKLIDEKLFAQKELFFSS